MAGGAQLQRDDGPWNLPARGRQGRLAGIRRSAPSAAQRDAAEAGKQLDARRSRLPTSRWQGIQRRAAGTALVEQTERGLFGVHVEVMTRGRAREACNYHRQNYFLEPGFVLARSDAYEQQLPLRHKINNKLTRQGLLRIRTSL